MKKKALISVFCLVLVVVFAVCLIGCNQTGDGILGGGSASYTGTYYKYVNGTVDSDSWIKLEKSKWSDSDETGGRLEYKDGTVYCYAEIFGYEDVLFWGTVSDGCFRWTLDESLGYENYYKIGSYKGESGNQGGNQGGTQNPPVETKNKYTVSFDSCGGSVVSSKTVEEGQKMTAPTQPTRTMFVFAGWYKDSKYKNVWDFDTDRVYDDMTLYARWTEEEVRITSVNGAEINNTEITMIVSDDENSVDLSNKVVLNSDTASWKLYYDELGQMEIPTKKATSQGGLRGGSNLFYIVVTSAGGTQSKTYTLDVYKKYEVTVRVMSHDDVKLGEYTVITLDTLRAPQGVSIDGYTINGWNSSGASVGSKVPKNSPTTITLKAKVTANKYTVTFNADGGSFSSNTKQVTYNAQASLGKAIRTGYSFLGWFYGETQITEEDGNCTWKITSNVTLKAKWRANRYAISVKADDEEAGSVRVTGNTDSVNLYFDENGVTATTFTDTQTISKYQGMTVPENPKADRYVFTGWYADKACTEAFDFSQNIASDVTVYAGWYRYTSTANSTTYGVISGYGADNATTISTTNSDQYRYFAATTDGTYTLHYKNASSGSNYATYLYIYDQTKGEVIKSNNTVSNTAYATYDITAKKGHVYFIKVYRYNYSNNFTCYLTRSTEEPAGGIVGSARTAVGEYQSTVTLSATTNNGYTFLGWYDGDKHISTEPTYELTVGAGDKTYTAKYTYYTVTTETNLEGAGTYTVMNEKKVSPNDSVNLTAKTNNGYTWLGWYEGDEKVSEGEDLAFAFTMTAESKIYTAKWAEYFIKVNLEEENAGAYMLGGVVSFDLNGANGTVPPSQGSATLVYPDIPTRSDYIFGGWYTNAEWYGRAIRLYHEYNRKYYALRQMGGI